MAKKRSRKFIVLLGLGLVLYVGVYAVLTLFGEYRGDTSGRRRLFSGLAVADSDHWQPHGTYLRVAVDDSGKRSVDGNVLGYAYAPLILIDRAAWHRSTKWEGVAAETRLAPTTVESDRQPTTAP